MNFSRVHVVFDMDNTTSCLGAAHPTASFARMVHHATWWTTLRHTARAPKSSDAAWRVPAASIAPRMRNNSSRGQRWHLESLSELGIMTPSVKDVGVVERTPSGVAGQDVLGAAIG